MKTFVFALCSLLSIAFGLNAQTFYAPKFYGDGSGLSNLVTSGGTGNVSTNGTNIFTGTNTFNGVLIATNTTNVLVAQSLTVATQYVGDLVLTNANGGAFTNLTGTNIVNSYVMLSAITNLTVDLNNGYQQWQPSNNCSVIGVSGYLANQSRWATLSVLNTNATAIQVTVTAATAKIIGGTNTLAAGMSIPANKVGVLSLLCMSTISTNVTMSVEQ